ncbi:MAG: hypothetical protein N2171_00430, partial [Clostridia bacterium]|nr:hypothetical protein [Clostridia bacterium]
MRKIFGYNIRGIVFAIHEETSYFQNKRFLGCFPKITNLIQKLELILMVSKDCVAMILAGGQG